MVTTDEIREHYDSLAFVYRSFWGDHIHHGLFLDGNESPPSAQVKLLDYCAGVLELRGGEHVLDVGCGHGGTGIYLATRYNCRVVGLTLSEKQARLARENARAAELDGRAKFLIGNAETWEFPTAAFDLVWTMESSEHFAEKRRYFQNVARSLRGDGKLLLAAWAGSMERPRVRQVARAFLCPELWTAGQYKAAIEAAGMRVQHCEDLTARVLRTWEICQERARAARPILKLLPHAAREFVEGIDVILDAYGSGDLSYTVLTARK